MPRRTTRDLLPLDPEIKKACRQNRKQVKLGKQPTTTPRPSLTHNRQQRGQASSLVVLTPPPHDIDPVIMADEDRLIRARLNRRTGVELHVLSFRLGCNHGDYPNIYQHDHQRVYFLRG
ncbi:unnamed protein product [Linum trigynum]|uniref:Uncharacterized protein n=1 Tax=Linum trigynum TaxID=586398 RepID=A0AAV2E066_9ROSI